MSNLNNSTRVSVTDAGQTLASADRSRRGLTLRNLGTNDVFVGTTGVTADTGLLLPANAEKVFSWDEVPQNEVVGICAAAETATVIVTSIT